MLLEEHGKQISEFCNTSAVKRPFFFVGHLYRRGVQKIEKSYSYGAWEAKKKVLHTEHGKHIFEFCNTSRAFCTFFDHEVAPNSVPVELGGGIYL